MNGIIGVCNEIMTILKHFLGLNKIKKVIGYSFYMTLAEGRPSVDFCSRVAFPNRETVNEIKTVFEFISAVDCTFSNEHLHEKIYAFGQPK